MKQYHTTGLVWSGTKSAGVPPPPQGGMPPPPPPLIADLNDLSVGDKSDDRSALFAAINQGENITRSNYILPFKSYFHFIMLYGTILPNFLKKDFLHSSNHSVDLKIFGLPIHSHYQSGYVRLRQIIS